MSERSPAWMRLDNAAKIYPAVRSRRWSAMFRLSLTLDREVDQALLSEAISNVLPRFPSFAMRLRRGLFWYYLERISAPPDPMPEMPSPCVPMRREEARRCTFRVLYYKNRIAVEFFHVVTDGAGGLVFLKTLVAEYLRLSEGKAVSNTHGVLPLDEAPRPGEYEDSFLRYEGEAHVPRHELVAYRLRGTRTVPGHCNLISGDFPLAPALAEAKKLGVSLTAWLTAILIEAIIKMQSEEVRYRARLRPVCVQVPVNLRRFFPSETLRNFALYVTPSIDPRMGDYTFEEIAKSVGHQLGGELNDKPLRARFTTNVRSEKNTAVKLLPLFLKNPVMKLVYSRVGERASSITLSNLGTLELPEEMAAHVLRADFVIGPLSQVPCICGAISYGGRVYMNFSRSIYESELERLFFTRLRSFGIIARLESNGRA